MEAEAVFEEKGWRALWKAVLDQAFKDAEGNVGTYDQREDARAWFASSRRDIGSFLWICEVLDLEPEITLARHDPTAHTMPHPVTVLFGHPEHAFAAAL